ncbi:reverse transcriptase domain-containing protein [Alteromonas sp. M12]|uniref:reverse transcriptase domain-containing protein n=1 Tax=Alteromonas sp. M12 TaxID=3135644 RepID=UPI00319E6B1E
MLKAKHVFTEAAIDTAYSWLCKQRTNFPANADIWHLRFHWHTLRAELLQMLNQQDYTFMPLSMVTNANGTTMHLWSSQDALVLKMLAMALPDALGLSPLCTHIKGHGGLKASVNDIRAALPDYSYVMKTDVKQYYQSIDHTLLLKLLDKEISDPFIWRLLVQFVKRSVEMGGTFKSITCGISRGCSLSPIIAAYYLKALDKKMEGDFRYFYRRYMDDVIVLAKTRWHLRKAVKTVNQHFNLLKVAQARDKTFIGKIVKTFDFLGYRFGLPELALAEKTITNAVNKVRQLYEQKQTAPKRAAALDDYITRWLRWVNAGIVGTPVNVVFCNARTQGLQDLI